MIKVKNIQKSYTTSEIETIALCGVNLEINKGEFVAIMGPSGSGKSTLLNIIGLLDSPSKGEYYFQGVNVSEYSEPERVNIRKGAIGFVFQNSNLIDELTIWENIELPLWYLKISTPERKKRVGEVLEKLNLMHRRDRFPKQLSGSQQQKMSVARAMVTNPKIILADEPTGNLDSVNGEEILKMLTMLNDEGVTVVLFTHSPYDSNYAHRIINLFDGKIITENITEQFHI